MTNLHPLSSSSSSVAQPPSSKSNPFARPSVAHSPSSFTRKTLLPTVPSPARPFDPLSTPGGNDVARNGAAESVGKGRTAWRLLWRGGLEIGKDGWRLDGVTFFALLSFLPPTPTAQSSNPFDVPILPAPGSAASPFNSLPTGDTDLCLSLESMRGRRYLQIRGLVDLPEHESLEGGSDAGVQMSIAPNAPLLAAYFTGLLCRNPKLSAHGRTLSAIAIGLGDDLDSPGSTVLVYGQRDNDSGLPTLKLCVGRSTPPAVPPSEKRVRPGEPLPRAPLFFPDKAPSKPPPPFPRNRTARSLSRAPSTSSIYAPPPLLPQPPPSAHPLTAGRTPGRRGEKRARTEQGDKEDERRRKAGRIIKPNLPSRQEVPETEIDEATGDQATGQDKDIFGKRGSSVAPSDKGEGELLGESGTASNSKRKVPSQQVLDNKAAIRKQVTVLMEERGCPRTHEVFKEVFGMVQRGTYFAFRHRLELGPLVKTDIRQIVYTHLDMYLPEPEPTTMLSQVKEEDEEDALFGETRQEYILADGMSSEVPTSGGILSEGAMSEEPMSDGLVSEDILPIGLLAEEG